MGKTLQKARRKAAASGIVAPVIAKSTPKPPSSGALSERISVALGSQQWDDALSALVALRGCPRGGPKLGAVQRWVRMADLCGDEALAARLLSGILLSVGAELPHASLLTGAASVNGSTAGQGAAPIHRHVPWAPPTVPEPAADKPAHAPSAAAASAAAGSFRALQPEDKAAAGPPQQQQQQRRTINRLDPTIYVTLPSAVAFGPQSLPAARVDVPHVPGAFVLTGVASADVCRQLMAMTEAMGYAADVDYSFSPDGSSDANLSAARGAAAVAVSAAAGERASGCVWLADESLLAPLYERCRPLLPQTLGGGTLAGLNARLRFYRYEPGAVYRPHVDGAWPASGLSPSGHYVFDAHGGALWSRLTLLLYLNEDFEGGATTFYAPAAASPSAAAAADGQLEAWGVAPRVGCALCFPHGDVAGSLVHEGSAVLKGVKYVVRTDVLYTMPPRAPRGGAAAAAARPVLSAAALKGEARVRSGAMVKEMMSQLEVAPTDNGQQHPTRSKKRK